MEFEWDAAKSDRNTRERGLPFELAALLLENDVLARIDARHDYGEIRVQAIGAVAGEVLACVYTMRGDTCRIVSLRAASRKERDAYSAYKKDRD
jgi:uncharacterized DUF497 family protein